MSLGTATEEVARSDELWNSTGVVKLREQQEKDFGIWGPYLGWQSISIAI